MSASSDLAPEVEDRAQLEWEADVSPHYLNMDFSVLPRDRALQEEHRSPYDVIVTRTRIIQKKGEER